MKILYLLIIKKWPNELREKLENIKIDKFYLASLDNPIAHSIFDDGSTSIIAPNMYTRYTDRVVGPKEITLERVINLSQAHYTIFDTNTVFPTEKLIKIPFDTKPKDFARATNGKTVKVFLG